MAAYCAKSDLYLFGLPRGSIPNPGRNVLDVDSTANSITLGDHGFDAGDLVSFRAEMGGSLPAPLVAGVSYYVLALTDDTFQVSSSEGGPALDLTTTGEGIVVYTRLPVDAAIAKGARVIDQALVNHAVPLTAPYPELVVMTNAELAAGYLGYFSGGTSKSLADMTATANKRIEAWARGVTVRGENNAPTERTNLAASAAVPYQDSRGWGRFGGIGRC